ncbi:MAG: hypothetical protein ACRD1D_12725, partial [Acidimicrobiales bacterium]
MATTEGGGSPPVDPPEPDADVVITTVVSADDPRPPAPAGDAEALGDDDDLGPHADDGLSWAWGDDAPPPPRGANGGATQKQLAVLEERLAALEGVPANVDTLGKAIRHELERCAGVLFGHDRALGALAARLDALEGAPRPTEAEGGAELPEGSPAEEGAAPAPAPGGLTAVAGQVDRLARRVAAMEARVEPLEPVPTVVQALRRAVRASDDLINGETAAREQALIALAGDVATEAQARDDAL